MAIINPYEDIQWDQLYRTYSVSHMHLVATNTSNNFNTAYNSGIRHFAISKYRPSLLTYPPDYQNGTFFYYVHGPTDNIEDIKQDPTHKSQVSIPKLTNYDDWKNTELSEMPVIQNEQIVFDPVAMSPNAEHVGPTLRVHIKDARGWHNSHWTQLHINGIGSRYESGLDFDPNSSSKGWADAYCQQTYTSLYNNIFNNLQFSDCGGLIVNHPRWTDKNMFDSHYYDIVRLIEDSLDFDPRVLGTDILEGGSQSALLSRDKREGDGMTLSSSEVLDAVLRTGRRCWCFAQPDWHPAYGKNELLIPSSTKVKDFEKACLKAYRNGATFGRYNDGRGDTGLNITSVEYDETTKTFTINTENAKWIQIIYGTEDETLYTVGDENAQTATFQANNDVVYIRAVVYSDMCSDSEESTYYANYKAAYLEKYGNYAPVYVNEVGKIDYDHPVYNDVVFTQPIILKPKTYPYVPKYDPDVVTKRAWSRRGWLWG